MKKSLIPVPPKTPKERTRYRIIRLDKGLLVLDCKEGRVWHPIINVWQSAKLIESIEADKGPKHTAMAIDFENDKGFRAIVEATTEYQGKNHTGNNIDSALWFSRRRINKKV